MKTKFELLTRVSTAQLWQPAAVASVDMHSTPHTICYIDDRNRPMPGSFPALVAAYYNREHHNNKVRHNRYWLATVAVGKAAVQDTGSLEREHMAVAEDMAAVEGIPAAGDTQERVVVERTAAAVGMGMDAGIVVVAGKDVEVDMVMDWGMVAAAGMQVVVVRLVASHSEVAADELHQIFAYLVHPGVVVEPVVVVDLELVAGLVAGEDLEVELVVVDPEVGPVVMVDPVVGLAVAMDPDVGLVVVVDPVVGLAAAVDPEVGLVVVVDPEVGLVVVVDPEADLVVAVDPEVDPAVVAHPKVVAHHEVALDEFHHLVHLVVSWPEVVVDTYQVFEVGLLDQTVDNDRLVVNAETA